MSKDEKPQPGDPAETALEKSGTIDERAPEDTPAASTTESLVAGAPAAYLPQMGTGMPGAPADDRGDGEAALEVERRAQRARGDIQRG